MRGQVFIFLFLLSRSFTLIQPGEITGIITDAESNQPLIGVNITIQGTSLGTSTDSSGKFSIPDLLPGSYNLRVSIVGYTPLIKNDIIVISGISVHIHLALTQEFIETEDVLVKPDNFKPNNKFNISYQNFSGEQMYSKPGNLGDIMRSLSMLPGIGKPADYRNDLIVRGGSPSENVFVVDGILVPDINHYTNQGSTGGPMSLIDPGYIKNISLSTGGFSADFGDKLSSVLQLDLSKGDSIPRIARFTISVSQLAANSNNKISEHVNYVFSIRRSLLELVFKTYRFDYSPVYYDMLSKIEWKINNQNSFSVLFIGALDDIKFFKTFTDRRNNNPRSLGSTQQKYTAGISYKSIFSDRFYIMSLSRNYLHYQSIPNYDFADNSVEIENTLKGDLTLKFSSDDILKFGFTSSIIQFNANIKLNQFVTSFKKLNNVNIDMNKIYYKGSLYMYYNFMVLKNFIINPGVRMDYFSALKEEKTYSPRFAVKLNISDNSNISLSGGVYRQSPAYIWLAAKNNENSLKQLRADHYIFAFEQRLRDDIKIKLESYYKLYKYYPVSISSPFFILSNTGSIFSGKDDNFSGYGMEPLAPLGNGTSRGIELDIQKKGSNILNYIAANINYNQTYFTGIDRIKRRGSFDQGLIINFVASFDIGRNWFTSSKFFYASGRPYTPFNKDGSQSVFLYNSSRMPAAHSLDMRIEKKWEFKYFTLSSYIDLRNIYNHQNIYYYYWNPLRKEAATDPSIRILPSLGIDFEI